MIVDAAVAVLLVLFGLAGARSGALRQLIHWSGLIAGWFGAGRLAALATPPMAALAPRVPAAAIRIGFDSVFFCFIAAVAAYAVDHTLGRVVEYDSRLDKHGGFLLGFGKGVVLIAAFLSVVIFFESPIVRFVPATAPQFVASRVLGAVRSNPMLKRVSFRQAAEYQQLADAARDPNALKARLASEPALQVLLSDPALKSALQNDRFVQALQKGDLAALENDPRLAALLKDPRLQPKP